MVKECTGWLGTTEPANGKDEILEKLPEWHKILREIYIKNFHNKIQKESE
jgi:hypothetical protein